MGKKTTTGHEKYRDDTGKEYIKVYYWCRDCLEERHDYVEISKFAGIVPKLRTCSVCGKRDCPVTGEEQ